MSFIQQDQNLIDQLLKSALEFETKFTKQGQEAANNTQQATTALQTQIKNLQDQINPSGVAKDPNATPTISHAGDASTAPELKSENLEGLGALTSWLVNNAITVDGQRVAYDIRQDPKSENYQLYQLEPNAGLLEVQDRSKATQGYFVDPALLNKYLVSLQAYVAKNPNQPLQVQLTKIVQEANKDLGANIKEQYQAPEKALSDNVVLDDVPKDLMDTRSSLIGGGVPLTYGDIKDDQTFNKWLNDHSISIKVGDKQAMINNPDFDKRGVLNILFERARFKVSRATDEESKEKATIYARQVQSIASQNNFHLGANPGSSSDMQGGNQKSNQQNQQNQNTSANSANLIKEIVDTLPLALQNIDFNRIREFFGKMAQLMSNNPTVMSYISNTEQLMQKTSALTANQDTVFQLGISPESLARMFADQKTPGKVFYPFVQLLDTIIDNVRAVINYFVSQYGNQINDSQRALVYGQIGRRPDDSSIYSRNVEYLANWMKTSHT
jgi:hypothetical protein